MDNFDSELKNNEELLDSIWINYFGNRNYREEVAKNKWNELYRGEFSYTDDTMIKGLNSLNQFTEFTKGNKEFSTRLIKKFFILVRENLNLKSLGNNQSNSVKAEKNDDDERNNDYFKMWDELNNKIQETFDVEYEKMKKINDIFEDTSLFSQLGWDLSKFSKEDMFIISKLDDTLINRKEILIFLEKIGKTHDNSSNKPKKKINMPKFSNEYIGINYDNNLLKLLPSELASLHHPLLKKLFYIKYSEKRLLNYSVEGNKEKKLEKIGISHKNGPIIICIDTSSSMNGLPEEIAKSIVLYILKTALKTKKEIYLIAFGSINELHEYRLTNKKNGLFQALDFLKKGFYGGTDFISPLNRCFSLIEEKSFKNSDILFISDGLGKVPKSFLKFVKEEKEKNDIKIFSILLNEKENKIEFSDEDLFYPVKNNKEFKGKITVYDKMGHYEYLDKH